MPSSGRAKRRPAEPGIAWLSGRAPRRGHLLEMLGLPNRQVVPRAPTHRVNPDQYKQHDEGGNHFDSPPRSALGRHLGELKLDRLLGSGSFAEVYHAVDETGRECAVKVLRPVADVVSRARLLREARAGIALRHENLVEVLRVGEVESNPYLVMEYVEGHDLRALIKKDGRFASARAARLVRQLASALAAVHRSGMIHRDVKPANILIRGAEPNEVLKLADMGLARLDEPELTQLTTAHPLGTPLYMAPEQAKAPHEANAAADMYSVGVVLFEMIVGAPPFQASSVMGLIQDHTDRAPPEPPLAEGLGTLALALLEKVPDRRPSAQDVINLLDEGFAERENDNLFTEDQTTAPESIERSPARDGEGTMGLNRVSTSPEPPTPTIVARPGSSAQFWTVLLVVGMAVAGLAFIGDRFLSVKKGGRAGSSGPTARIGSSSSPVLNPVRAVPLAPIEVPPSGSVATSSGALASAPPRREHVHPTPSKVSKPALPPRRWPTRVGELLAAHGMGLEDLQLNPELDEAARAMSGTEPGAPAEERFMTLLGRPELPRRLAGAKLMRVRAKLEGMAESLPSDQLATLESRYLRFSSALRREPFSEKLKVEISALLDEVEALQLEK